MMRVIVVDDDPLACRILERMLRPEYDVIAYGDGESAFRHLLEKGADILLTDLKMPRMNGFDLLSKVKEVAPEVIVFILTGHSSIDTAVTAIKKGACDYIAKPFDPDDVLLRLRRAVKERSLEKRVNLLEQQLDLERDKYVPLSNHPKMEQLLALARKVARTHSTVLIQGETGVGKELVARMIHNWSPRAEHAFVPVNCGALADGVLESELFGHEKGAFTGAVNRRIGYLEMAHRGTLLLDEIGTTDNTFQVKLLRVLQDRIIYRVGSTAAVAVDIRVLAATNQNLEREAREDLFRSDLFYRLSVVTLTVPPLRERREDIPLLAQHFLRKYRHINPRVEGVAPEGFRLLAGYHYPGNVRELENIIERAMILETGLSLGPDSLLLGEQSALQIQPARRAEALGMEEAEKEHILKVLERCGGRKVEAARRMGINKTTLWRKMKKFGLQAE